MKAEMYRPATPPTALRAVPPPRSGEGWRPACPNVQSVSVQIRTGAWAGLHPSPERGAGTAKRWVGMEAEELVTFERDAVCLCIYDSDYWHIVV